MKICYVGNIASHYRAAIFQKMADELNCDFYFGNACDDEKSIDTLSPSFFHSHAEELPRKKLFHTNLYWTSSLFKIFNKYDLYIFVGEPYWVTSWLFIIFLKLFTHKKVVFWTHGWYGRESWGKKIIKKVYFHMSDYILTYGNYARHLMIKEGFSSEKISAIHNSLDYEKQIHLRDSSASGFVNNHFGNGNKSIVFSGRLTKAKRLDQILTCLFELKQEGLDINCIFIGDGPEKFNLIDLSRQLHIENNMWFYGACYDEKIISDIFSECEVCVSPGNVGLTAIHSMTFGCPVITHNNYPYQGPEFEAIIPGKTGDFFTHGDISEMKELIRKWCSLSLEKRMQIREYCYQEMASNWNPDYQMTIMKDMITKLFS